MERYEDEIAKINLTHIRNGLDSHLVFSRGVSQDLGALGTTTNGGLALPQNLGSMNTAGSDGRRWMGCAACHAVNGAYSTLAYNSPDAWTGRSIAATFNAAFFFGQFSGGSSRVTVGQWMTQAEYNAFKSTGMIPRGNVLANGFLVLVI